MDVNRIPHDVYHNFFQRSASRDLLNFTLVCHDWNNALNALWEKLIPQNANLGIDLQTKHFKKIVIGYCVIDREEAIQKINQIIDKIQANNNIEIIIWDLHFEPSREVTKKLKEIEESNGWSGINQLFKESIFNELKKVDDVIIN